jgi:hypothetical protein
MSDHDDVNTGFPMGSALVGSAVGALGGLWGVGAHNRAIHTFMEDHDSMKTVLRNLEQHADHMHGVIDGIHDKKGDARKEHVSKIHDAIYDKGLIEKVITEKGPRAKAAQPFEHFYSSLYYPPSKSTGISFDIKKHPGQFDVLKHFGDEEKYAEALDTYFKKHGLDNDPDILKNMDEEAVDKLTKKREHVERNFRNTRSVLRGMAGQHFLEVPKEALPKEFFKIPKHIPGRGWTILGTALAAGAAVGTGISYALRGSTAPSPEIATAQMQHEAPVTLQQEPGVSA